jgi:hypothetical protein
VVIGEIMEVAINKRLGEDGWTNNFLGAHSSGWDIHIEGARLALLFYQEEGIEKAVTHYFVDIKGKRVVGNKVYWKDITKKVGFWDKLLGGNFKEETYRDYDLNLGKQYCVDLYEAVKDLDLEALTEEDRTRLGISEIEGPIGMPSVK